MKCLCALFIYFGIRHIGVAKVSLYTMQQMIHSILEKLVRESVGIDYPTLTTFTRCVCRMIWMLEMTT